MGIVPEESETKEYGDGSPFGPQEVVQLTVPQKGALCQEKWPTLVQDAQRRFKASSSSSVRGQSEPSSRDKLRSASTLPPVWQRAQ